MSYGQQKKRVLLIQSLIPHYRVPVFNELAKYVDLTVVYDNGTVPDDVEFGIVKIDTTHIKHIPRIHKKNILRMAKKYDVVITMLDGSFLTTHLLCWLRGKTKLILWGIGVAAGYNTRFDSSQETSEKYFKMIQKADAALFYSKYPVEKYSALGEVKEKLFVANNTVRVMPTQKQEKDSILFVGSLYKAKRIFELLEGYKKAYKICEHLPKLVIIGDGEDSADVAEWVNDNRLTDDVVLTGAIYDEEVLAEYFSHAIMCISPDQAGLTVLKSFGYGVPFVTHKDAITGGERLNIKNKENGLLIDSFDEIAEVIADCAKNKDSYIEMGNNAKRFYDENRTVKHMVNGFLEAITFVTND